MAESARSVAIRAVREAGSILRERLGRVQDVRYKGTVDLVTEADDASERAILRILGEVYPDHEVLTEESGLRALGRPARHRWIVDPLDGTTNFAHGFPIFAVSIALAVDGALELGVVYLPVLDELFVAERGRGATLNGEPIRVSTTDTLIRAMVATGFAYDRQAALENVARFAAFLPVTQAIRRAGSAAADLSYVACGRYDGYWESNLSPWDTAAGVLLVAEAGGRVTDYAGGPYRLDGLTCLASNGRIHDLMLEVLARSGQGDPAAL